MAHFIICDWGTSNFRLRLVDKDRQAVLGEMVNDQGIIATFEEWQRECLAPEERLSYYLAALRRQIHFLQEELDRPLQGLPLILSGMASSHLGMMELHYKQLPVGTTGMDLYRKEIPASDDFPHHLVLVSGIRTDKDVMRGEETQLIGCISPADQGERLFIFPGTHSKHVRVKDGQVLGFSTYMTGEFFHLLSTKSILAASVDKPREQNPLPAFEAGVKDSRHSGLLHGSFLVRTRQLLDNCPKEDNYSYLSGLLIGEELKPLAGITTPLTIVSSGPLAQYYLAACHHLGLSHIDTRDGDQSLVKGHCKLLY
jgi:2-dehydro-3-deoxygalactonokinase